MSILIKGMEMPKDEGDSIHILRDGTAVVYRAESIDFYKAVPVPPHGKLGDLDRLAKEVEDMGKEFPPDSIGAERYRLFAEFIKTAPTILEAEEGE